MAPANENQPGSSRSFNHCQHRFNGYLRFRPGVVQTERFDVTGDWQGSIWFDHDKQFVKAEYMSNKRKVTVLLDP